MKVPLPWIVTVPRVLITRPTLAVLVLFCTPPERIVLPVPVMLKLRAVLTSMLLRSPLTVRVAPLESSLLSVQILLETPYTVPARVIEFVPVKLEVVFALMTTGSLTVKPPGFVEKMPPLLIISAPKTRGTLLPLVPVVRTVALWPLSTMVKLVALTIVAILSP